MTSLVWKHTHLFSYYSSLYNSYWHHKHKQKLLKLTQSVIWFIISQKTDFVYKQNDEKHDVLILNDDTHNVTMHNFDWIKKNWIHWHYLIGVYFQKCMEVVRFFLFYFFFIGDSFHAWSFISLIILYKSYGLWRNLLELPLQFLLFSFPLVSFFYVIAQNVIWVIWLEMTNQQSNDSVLITNSGDSMVILCTCL